jgi:hypothetical protein
MEFEELLTKVRTLTGSLEKSQEKLSHGSPCFFIEKGRQYASVVDNHHGDGRRGLWLIQPPGFQEALIQENSEVYFRPPYVGPSGWIGVRCDRDLPWATIVEHIEVAYTYALERSGPKRK